MEKSEFCVLIKHCFLMAKNTVQAKQCLDKCYSGSAPSETTVKRWYADFKRVCTDKWCWRLRSTKSSSCPGKYQKSPQIRLADCKLKLHDIAEELKIWEGSVFAILHEHLSMRKVSPKWVPRLLKADQKQRVDDSECCLQRFQHNKKGVLA